jgi:hypothetical protein
MTNCLRWDGTAADAGGGTAPPAADSWPGRYLIAVMLLTAAALDVTRCGLAAIDHQARPTGQLTSLPPRQAGPRRTNSC